MIKRLTLALIAIGFISVCSIAQTSLEGKVIDDNGEPVLFGDVAVFRNDVLVTGTQTDFDGNFSITNLDPGTYDIQASYVGLQTTKIAGVVVFANKANRLEDIVLSSGVMLDLDVVVVDYKVPLIEQDKTQGGQTLTSEQIRNLPTRSVNAIVATTAGTTGSSPYAPWRPSTS